METNVVDLKARRGTDAQIDAAIEHLESILRLRGEKLYRALGAIDALIVSAKSEVRALETRRAELLKGSS